jgi:hypothetical protein
MGFNSKFTSIINNLFLHQQAHIIDSGIISEPFKVERGVRQGDPLSPLLYILAFDPFLQSLKSTI